MRGGVCLSWLSWFSLFLPHLKMLTTTGHPHFRGTLRCNSSCPLLLPQAQLERYSVTLSKPGPSISRLHRPPAVDPVHAVRDASSLSPTSKEFLLESSFKQPCLHPLISVLSPSRGLKYKNQPLPHWGREVKAGCQTTQTFQEQHWTNLLGVVIGDTLCFLGKHTVAKLKPWISIIFFLIHNCNGNIYKISLHKNVLINFFSLQIKICFHKHIVTCWFNININLFSFPFPPSSPWLFAFILSIHATFEQI